MKALRARNIMSAWRREWTPRRIALRRRTYLGYQPRAIPWTKTLATTQQWLSWAC
jgi:hypothetical protein